MRFLARRAALERDSKREFENGTVPIQADEIVGRYPCIHVRARVHRVHGTYVPRRERAVVFQRAVDLVPHMHTYTGCLVNRRANGN